MWDQSTELEIIMKEALIINEIFFDEQVYTKKVNGVYIFDFVVYGEYSKIVVECDGPHHYKMERFYLDSIRDLWCIQNGFQDVIRFSKYDIRRNIDACISFIQKTISELDTALNHDKKRYQIMKEEKNKIIARKNSHFYNGEKPFSKYSGKRVKIIQDISPVTSNPSNFQYESINKLKNVEKDIPEKEVKNIESSIPSNEIREKLAVKHIPKSDKKLLLFLINNSNKDGIAIYRGQFQNLRFLINCKLININTLYKSKDHEYSIFVLPNAPTLLKILKNNNSWED